MVYCDQHQCVKDKLDSIREDRRFWHRILYSKWTFWAGTVLILAFFGWMGWVSDAVYAQKDSTKQLSTICEDLKSMKKEIKEDNDKKAEQRERDQRELTRMLMEIQKQLKNGK